MISYLEGTLADKDPTSLVVDVKGVGFRVNISLSYYEKLGAVGSQIRVLTYLHVKADGLELYGFKDQDERELFETLIKVSGVGPRLAQTVLSGMSVGDFKMAVAGEDIRAITSIQGVGKKMGQRLIMELKERFGKIDFGIEAPILSDAEGEIGPEQEALLALRTLGMDDIEARRAVAKMIKKSGNGLSAQQIIKGVLRQT